MTPEEELALAALEQVQWSAGLGEKGWCPACWEPRCFNHASWCPLRKALDALRAKKAAGSSTVAVEPTEEKWEHRINPDGTWDYVKVK